MTDTERERQRIVAIIQKVQADIALDYLKRPDNESGNGLAILAALDECIDKIMEATDEL